jgi:sulfur carrier protein ThiS|tara:strand:- start:2688 stop:2897 length:210 start_codon:yes stop_codon:yes gene_type:complete
MTTKSIIFSINNSPRSLVNTEASTVGDFIAEQSIDAEGSAFVVEGSPVDRAHVLNDGNRLTISRASKGA